MAQEIKPGQIWKEVDNRRDRWVRVQIVQDAQVQIQTVVRDDKTGDWVNVAGTRPTWASPYRFNGVSGNYALVQDV